MGKEWSKFPILKEGVRLLQLVRLPGLNGFSFYDLFKLYFTGILHGTITSRAAAISFSFFMALFPFLLFVLNIIPFVPSFFNIENFDTVLLDFVRNLLPTDTHAFFTTIFTDIQSKPRGGLLSSVFVLSIFLSANGVNSIFTGFETSYHVKELRNIFNQYLYSLGVSVILAIFLLIAVIAFVYFKLTFQDVLPEGFNFLALGQYLFFVLLAYFSISVLYYFGTVDGKLTHFSLQEL